jgi:hypothetical protein
VAVIWTYSVASGLLALVIGRFFGHPGLLGATVRAGLQPGYAVLIGGPIGAAIVAKGLVVSQVTKGQSKPAAQSPSAADLVSGDQGGTDLGDLQYLLFNTVALVFFYGEFLTSPQRGLPTIPNVLIGLTSVSAVGYVAKKALPAARAITKVDPATVPLATWNAGTTVKVYGTNLLSADTSAPDTVRFSNATGSVEDPNPVAENTTAEGLILDATIPANTLAAGTYDCTVITNEGTKVTKSQAVVVS